MFFSSKLKYLVNHRYCLYIQRLFASSKSDQVPTPPPPNARITVTDDGQTIVCWHPPEPFPYECSLPYVDGHQLADHHRSSALNIETMEKGENIYHQITDKRLGLEQLQAITYTNKDHWRRRRSADLQLEPEHPRKGV